MIRNSTPRVVAFALLIFLSLIAFEARAAADDWSKTIAGAVLNGRLYTVEKSGTLYSTDLATGKYVAIGKPEFAKTRFIFAGPQNLFTIESDGSLYKVNPVSGAWTQVGEAGAWKNTIAGTFDGERLYTVESGGALYVTNTATGIWVQVGKPEFANTARIYSQAGSLYTIEKDGSLYRINPANGTWARVGQEASWKGTVAGAILGASLFTVEASGNLYETNLSTGAWRKIGKPDFAKTRHLFAAGNALFTMEDGGLYRVNPSTGAWVAIG